jgi:inner membrane transporter RhtA
VGARVALITIEPMSDATTRAPDSGWLARAPSGGLVVAAIASVQFGGALAVRLFAEVGPAGAVLLRLGSASIVLFAVSRPRLEGQAWRQLPLVAAFGLVLAAMNLSFYSSIHRIPLGIAVSLEFLGPLSVAVAGSRRRVDLLWVALAGVGILALTHGGSHGVNGLGVALALLAGGLWAAYILLSARVGRAFERGTGLSLAMGFATLATLPVGVASAGSHLLTLRSLALGSAVGMLSSAIPYSFELEALRRIAPPVFGVLMSLEPAMAALAGLLILNQGLTGRAVVGIALVITASIGAARRTREPPTTV